MKRLSLFTSAAIVALLAVAPARADLVSWSYDWQRAPVSIAADTPPGPPTASNAGSIAAHVEITAPTTNGDSPEPASLVLAGLGLLLSGGAAWRRRRLALRLA